MEFIRLRDKEGKSIQNIRTDRGGEFSSALFQAFLSEKGIYIYTERERERESVREINTP